MLINPNGNAEVTAAMAAQAQLVLDCKMPGPRCRVLGRTNQQAPPLLASPADMQLAAAGVLALGVQAEQEQACAIIVAAFSDPGMNELRGKVSIPVLGIGESAFAEAAKGGRHFGIVTITPDVALLASFTARATELGVGGQYCGAHVTQGDAHTLLANVEQLDRALAVAIAESIADGAQAIILGGGPLSAAAERLQSQFAVPLLNPVSAAARAVVQLGDGRLSKR
ncbi:aspartate/glutamate racemase family protein [Oceanisphaera ostreae]|uniref:Aspartate/glutamate racemase family protein n=1 Tax=Oceanisphaera ostreae TaxID=914151 RepID=A0ABW3KGH0_9GAMM